MGLLVLGRLSCTNPWSGHAVGASAAAGAPFVGADHGALMRSFYVAAGDRAGRGYRLWPRMRDRFLLFLPLLAALAFATKPVVRVLANSCSGCSSDRFAPARSIRFSRT